MTSPRTRPWGRLRLWSTPRRAVAIAAILALAVTACGGGSETADDADGSEPAAGGSTFESPEDGVSADTIRWGLIYDQTGPTANSQQPFADGITLAIDAANEAGGVHGRTIELVSEDEKYEVPVALAAYDRLVNDTPVLGMTALNNSSFQGAVVERLDQEGVPVLGAQSTSASAVNPQREYFWAMQCSWTDQADVAVAHAFQELGEGHSAVTVYGNVASGEEYQDQIQRRVEAGGGDYLGSISVEFGAPEADAQAQEIARLQPDVVHLHGTSTNGIPLVTSMEKFGLTDTMVIGGYGLHVADIPRAAPELADNFNAVDCYSFAGEGSEELQETAEAAGLGPEDYTRREFTNGWVVGRTIVAALEGAGPEPTRETLNAAIPELDEIDTGGLSGNITFASDDHIGIDQIRPFAFNAEADAFEPVGEYADWADCIVFEDMTESLDGYDPVGCAAGG